MTAAPPAAQTAARKTAQAFEGAFVGQMTKIMMETAQVAGDFSGGHGEDMFRGVLAEQLGTRIASSGGIGLAPKILDEIIRLQGGARDVA